MSEQDQSKIDLLLDLLLDALLERQAARRNTAEAATTVEAAQDHLEPLVTSDSLEGARLAENQEREIAALDNEYPEMVALPEPQAVPDVPEKLPSIQLDQMLARLTIFIIVLLVVINIPFNRYGTNLARAMPDEQALVIRDGLVLKGDGDEIYVLEDNHKRWISSLDAFDYYGYRWGQVNQVADDFLAQFPDGPALSILYKCATSPHVYAIENGQRRWIKDIPTFEAQGYVWEDVQIVPCSRINNLPAGPPIPPDAGEPPES